MDRGAKKNLDCLIAPAGRLEIRNFKNFALTETLNLNPGYFAFVMATGITSAAADVLGMHMTGAALFLVNKIAYAILVLLMVARILFSPSGGIKSIARDEQGISFFTVVAATCVLGGQFIALQRNISVGFVLWIVGAVLWAVLLYSVFFAAMTSESKRPIGDTLNGGWMIFVVGTQAVSILGTMVAPFISEYEGIFLFAMLLLFLLGCMLYIVLITLIINRLFFFSLSPENFTPPYWILMGAAAITTLSGTTLVTESGSWEFIPDILPFLKGLSYFFWSVATWWIPLLLAMNVWKHIPKRIPYKYDVQNWNMVFPLGMYAFCTHQLTKMPGLDFLSPIPYFFIYFALLAWVITFLGLIRQLITMLFVRPIKE